MELPAHTRQIAASTAPVPSRGERRSQAARPGAEGDVGGGALVISTDRSRHVR